MTRAGFLAAIVFLISAYFCVAVGAPLQPEGVTMVEAAQALTDAGLKPQVIVRKDATFYLRSEAEGLMFAIRLYGCEKDGRCRALQFHADFEPASRSADILNVWNREFRFAKAYVDKDGSINLDMDVVSTHSSAEFLADNVKIFASISNIFGEYLNCSSTPGKDCVK